MIKGINQSMVNRSIAGGGVNCKCINGNGISGDSTGSSGNGSGVSGGKIEVEFTVYNVNDDNYITNEDASKIYNRLYNAYPTKYIIFSYEEQMVYIVKGEYIADSSWRGSVIQYIDYTFDKEYTVANYLMSPSRIILVFTLKFSDKETVEDGVTIMEPSGDELKPYKKTNSNDPKLESANATKYSLTLYYRER